MQPHAVMGRERELAVVADLLRRVAGALLVRGEAGVGKTTLLQTALGTAPTGTRVLQATAVESETGLPFSALHALLRHRLDEPIDLRPAHREALETVLGRATGATPDPLLLREAVHAAATASPDGAATLLVLEDAQWMDRASAEVLAFVVRRAGGGLGAVVTVRSGEGPPGPFETAGLPELEIGPLPPAVAQDLLDRVHPGLAPDRRRLVLDLAAGNPLALTELPTSGGDLEQPLALGRRLQAAFGARLPALPGEERAALLRRALDDPTAPGGDEPHGEALRLGLLVAGDDGYRFRHPLVRSAVVADASPEERRAAHRALAHRRTDSLERRALHLARAATGPDEAVATLLETAARRQVVRGATRHAVDVLERAADLSPSEAERARRLRDAAFLAGQVAQVDRTLRLLEAAHAGGPPAVMEAVTVAMVELFGDGAVALAEARLTAALAAARASGEEALVERVLASLLSLSMFSADGPRWRRTLAVLEELRPRLGPLLLLFAETWGDLTRAEPGVRDRVLGAIAAARDVEPWNLMRLLVCAYYTDAVPEVRRDLDRAVEAEAGAGAVASAIIIGQVDLLDRAESGAWDDAVAIAEGLVAEARARGLGLLEHQTLGYLGVVLADRGDAGAEEIARTVREWAVPRSVGLVAEHALLIEARAAAARGDAEQAFRALAGITPPGTIASAAHLAARTVLDLVEAAVDAGRSAQAREHALAAERRGVHRIGPRAALHVAGALAMTAPPSTAERAFEAALALPAATRLPFEAARIRFAQGRWSRAHHRPEQARRQLAAAVDAFDALGAAPWSARAAAELRAAGGRPAQAATDVVGLTPQEAEVVRLAATGLTNREIGARLFLSPRTVASHLYRAFPKLGVATRAGLRDALERTAVRSID